MATKTETGNVTQEIPNTNLILVQGGGIETLICTSERGITRQDLLGFEAWLKEQPDKIYDGPPMPKHDPFAEEKARKMQQFLKEHPIPPELLMSRD